MTIRRERFGSLAGDLRALGYDAEEVGRSVIVRLPLMSSVTIEADDGGIKFFPRFGAWSRDRAAKANFSMFTALAGLSLFVPVVAALAASWIVVLLGDVSRYTMTEGVMGAVRSLVLVNDAA